MFIFIAAIALLLASSITLLLAKYIQPTNYFYTFRINISSAILFGIFIQIDRVSVAGICCCELLKYYFSNNYYQKTSYRTLIIYIAVARLSKSTLIASS